jgi:hypothetical protein
MSVLALAKLKTDEDAGAELWALVADDYLNLSEELLPDEGGEIYILARLRRYPDGMVMALNAEQYLSINDFDLDVTPVVGPAW